MLYEKIRCAWSPVKQNFEKHLFFLTVSRKKRDFTLRASSPSCRSCRHSRATPFSQGKTRVSFVPFFTLTRPLNCLITALSVYVGALTAGTPPFPLTVLVAALSAALVTGAGNAFNDAMDIEIDRINRPQRPLPAGLLSRRAACCAALLLALAGWVLAVAISPLHSSLAGAVIGGLTIYSISLKNSILWGNISVALIASAAFPYGALATGDPGRSWIPAGFAFCFHLGREIVKDIEDVEGDRTRGDRTLPLRWGLWRAALIASFIYLFLVAFTLFPWFVDIYGLAYLLPVALVDLLVLFVLFRLHASRGRLRDAALGQTLKAGMFLGLLAIVAGELFR